MNLELKEALSNQYIGQNYKGAGSLNSKEETHIQKENGTKVFET